MASFQRHLFLCINERVEGHPRGCCHSKDGVEVAAAFKKAIHDRGLKRVLRANKAGCLDQCARGVAAVVYPEGVWYGGITVEDVDEIIDSHLIGGRPVERLRLAERELTGRDITIDAAVAQAAQEPKASSE